MKKHLSRLIVAILATVTAFTSFGALAACGNDKVVTDGKTVNVRFYKAGYGTTYLTAMKEKFEAAYADEGYKINVLAGRADLTSTNVFQDIYSGKGADLYFVSGCDLWASLNGDYAGTEGLFADITESVYNQKPIKFDKTEEDVTVKDKLGNLADNYEMSYDSKYYGLPYALSVAGLAVNKTKLESYGLSLPKTTNQMFACSDEIMKKASETGDYPYTFSTTGNNYPSIMYNTWMAQYGGLEEFNRFWSMSNDDGSPMENCYEVFGYESIEKMLEVTFRAFDPNTAAPGSLTQDFTSAQSKIVNGEAVFYSVGDWFFNEVSANYSAKLNDIAFIKVPVISSLGTKLFGSGTAYALDDAKCEEVLVAIIDAFDEGKSTAEIIAAATAKAGKTVGEADVEKVCEARGLTRNSSETALAYVSNKASAEAKEIAALFLRMCASTDGASLIAKNTQTSNPFATDALKDSEYQWFKDVNAITSDSRTVVFNVKSTGYRYVLGLDNFSPYLGGFIASNVLGKEVSVYTTLTGEPNGNSLSVFTDAAKAMAEENYTQCRSQFTGGKWNPIAAREGR